MSNTKVIALTFDAGSSNAAVNSILDTLAQTGTQATFFLTGNWARAYPADARRIAQRFPVGNHSMTHPDFTALSDTAIRTELTHARSAIMAATGHDPRPYFRFPSGAVNAHTIRVVNEQCYVPFRWTVDTLGWKGTSGGLTVAKVRDRVLSGARPGAIILMHVGANPDDQTTLDAQALPAIIAGLHQAGYTMVTLETALGH